MPSVTRIRRSRPRYTPRRRCASVVRSTRSWQHATSDREEPGTTPCRCGDRPGRERRRCARRRGDARRASAARRVRPPSSRWPPSGPARRTARSTGRACSRQQALQTTSATSVPRATCSRRALAEAPRGRRRAQVLLLLGGVLKDSVHSDRAARVFSRGARPCRRRCLLFAPPYTRTSPTSCSSAPAPLRRKSDARRALELAEGAGDDALLAQCLAALARIEFWLGRGVQRAAMERAVELERAGADLRLDPRPSLLLAGQLATAGDLVEAREHLSRALRSLRELGRTGSRGPAPAVAARTRRGKLVVRRAARPGSP